MIKNTIIIALVIVLIYLYYQNRKKPHLLSGNPTDPNYQQEISETIANLKEEAEDLETERDKAIRDKRETEQQLLAINNRLNNKVQESKRKEEEIARLKKEFGEKDKSLNKKITELNKTVKEKNGLITSLNQEKLTLKEKYNQKVKQFDEEQLEGKKFEEENEKLQTKITELEKERQNLLTELSKNEDLDEFSAWLNDDETRKANLPEWDKIIGEVKQKIRDYHLLERNWSSGWLKGNKEYWKVFQAWTEKD